MKELSRLAQAVQASTTMAIDSMFKQMKADGIDVIGFGAEIGRASCRERV